MLVCAVAIGGLGVLIAQGVLLHLVEAPCRRPRPLARRGRRRAQLDPGAHRLPHGADHHQRALELRQCRQAGDAGGRGHQAPRPRPRQPRRDRHRRPQHPALLCGACFDQRVEAAVAPAAVARRRAGPRPAVERGAPAAAHRADRQSQHRRRHRRLHAQDRGRPDQPPLRLGERHSGRRVGDDGAVLRFGLRAGGPPQDVALRHAGGVHPDERARHHPRARHHHRQSLRRRHQPDARPPRGGGQQQGV